MTPSRLTRTLIAVLGVLAIWAAPVSAQVTVLSTDFGGGGLGELADAVNAAVASESGQDLLEADFTARYGEPIGLDAAVIAESVAAGTDAFFEMNYDSALELLNSTEIEGALVAVDDMGANTDLSDALLEALLARARAELFNNSDPTATIGEMVRLFPGFSPTADRYEEDFVSAYDRTRVDFLVDGQPVRIHNPSGCDVFFNGQNMGHDEVLRLTILEGAHAVVSNCDGAAGAIHRLSVPRDNSIVVDARFDQRFQPLTGEANVGADQAANLNLFGVLGLAAGDITGATEVILAGQTEESIQLVRVQVEGAQVVNAVRADLDDIEAAVASLYSGSPAEGVTMVSDWGNADGDVSMAGGGGGSIAPWILYGIGGAGAIVGTIFAISESGSFSDFEDCQADPVCANSGELDTLRSDGDTAGLIATIGFGTALVGITVGTILLVVDSGSDSGSAAWLPDGRHANGFVPAVSGDVTSDGGRLQLDWDF